MDYLSLIIVGLLGIAGYIGAYQIIFRYDYSRRGRSHPSNKRIVPTIQIAACLSYLAYAILHEPDVTNCNIPLLNSSLDAFYESSCDDASYGDWRDAYYLASFLGLAFFVIAMLTGAIASLSIDRITGQKNSETL